jgi:hypothetical protein
MDKEHKAKSSVKQIRLDNLKRLFNEFKTQHNLPDRGAGTAFSMAIGTTPKHFTVVKNGTSNIGDVFAAKIEKNLGLPAGYLDIPQTASAPKNPAEEGFIETALTLFRLSPEAAQEAMMEALRARLLRSK